MINVKRIRKLTAKSKLRKIENYIEECAESGQDLTCVNTRLNTPFEIDGKTIKYLQLRGFKIFRAKTQSDIITISWR
jgi:hypothetical protein